MRKILDQNKFATLYLDEEIPAISEEWHGSASIEEFQSLLHTKLELFAEYKMQFENLHWIANVVGLKINNEAKNWANQLFHKQLFPAGVKIIAFIVPKPVYDKLSEEYHKEKMDAQKEIRVRYFDSYEKASEWLKSATLAIPSHK